MLFWRVLYLFTHILSLPLIFSQSLLAFCFSSTYSKMTSEFRNDYQIMHNCLATYKWQNKAFYYVLQIFLDMLFFSFCFTTTTTKNSVYNVCVTLLPFSSPLELFMNICIFCSLTSPSPYQGCVISPQFIHEGTFKSFSQLSRCLDYLISNRH